MRHSRFLKTYFGVVIFLWLFFSGIVAYGMRWSFLEVITSRESFMLLGIIAVLVAVLMGIAALAIRGHKRLRERRTGSRQII